VPVIAADGRQAREMGRAQGINVATVQYQDGRGRERFSGRL
jgi:hypothetical protein